MALSLTHYGVCTKALRSGARYRQRFCGSALRSEDFASRLTGFARKLCAAERDTVRDSAGPRSAPKTSRRG
jgi:hypothetical protein